MASMSPSSHDPWVSRDLRDWQGQSAVLSRFAPFTDVLQWGTRQGGSVPLAL